MANPYQETVNETFRGKRVKVATDYGSYNGWLGMRNYGKDALILHGAEQRETKKYVGAVVLNGVKGISLHDPPEEDVREIDPAEVAESPYSVRQYDDADMDRYVRTVRRRGGLWTLPVVRPVDDGYEIVSGHKRFEAARQAELDRVPVKVVDLDEREALVWFVDEHLPMDTGERNQEERGRGYYADDEADRAVEVMLEDWPEELLDSLPQVSRVLDPLFASESHGSDVDRAIEALEERQDVDEALAALRGTD